MIIHVDANWATKNECKYHCYPSCHPGQIFNEPAFGCTHIAWPPNQEGDFCPIVSCKGVMSRCEIPKLYLTKNEERELGFDKMREDKH